MKAVLVSGTDSIVKSGLAAMQIGTALLVKVCLSVFVVNCLQLQVLDCLNCGGGGSNLQGN